MNRREWDKILEKLIDSPSFVSGIKKKGYYISPDYPTFRKYTEKEWNTVSTTNTANFLSKDFWSQQSKVLTNRNYYLIRTGEGSFAIFDENEFPRPYLDLRIENTVEIIGEEPTGYDNLKKAFEENLLENTALEQLRFNKAYDKLIELVTDSKQEYYVGVRGNTTRTFDVYFQRSNLEIEKIFTYKGQAELDYTLWTKNIVFLFEAKKSDTKTNFDIGWHKFAYPAVRFLKYENFDIYPVYFLRRPNRVILFVFPKFVGYNGGLILNDSKQMTPSKIFSVIV